MSDQGKRPDREAGLSLLEITLAMCVMVVGLFSLVQAMSAAMTLERTADERKIAYAFCNSQLETIRGRTFSQIRGLPTDSPSGYQIGGTLGTFAGSTISSGFGFKRSLDNDGDADHFGLYYYANNPMFVNNNPLLLGLTPQTGVNPPRVAEVTFRDPDGTTGVTEGMGYWVTVRVFWRGVQGNTDVRMSSFVTAR